MSLRSEAAVPGPEHPLGVPCVAGRAHPGLSSPHSPPAPWPCLCPVNPVQLALRSMSPVVGVADGVGGDIVGVADGIRGVAAGEGVVGMVEGTMGVVEGVAVADGRAASREWSLLALGPQESELLRLAGRGHLESREKAQALPPSKLLLPSIPGC